MAVLNLQLGSPLHHPESMEITPEDIDKARDIGVLTPRDVLPGEDPELEFLLFQHSHEGDDIMDELEDLWKKDMERITCDLGPILYGGLVLPPVTTQEVRITFRKPSFYIGSIAGQISDVFIPANIIDGILELHTPYLMDLEYKPTTRNKWCATMVHEKLDTSGMLVSTVSHNNCGIYVFHVPMKKYSIGVVIGKEGKNINSLIKYVDRGYTPDATNYPTVDLEAISEDLVKVSVYVPPASTWTYDSVLDLVSYIHS